MAHLIDLNELISNLQAAASDILAKDITAIQGFSQSQLTALAKQAALIAKRIARNDLSDERRRFFLENLAEMAENFVRVLKGLAEIMIEKVWNALVDVLWGTIGKAVNTVLPLPVWPHA